MKKIIIALLLSFALITTLSACAESASNDDSSETNSTEANESIEVDENLLTVEITLPAEYAEGTTQEDLDKDVKIGTYKSATLNDDGSVTYIMTKKQHKELLSTIVDDINKNLNDMIGSEDYPNITDISANDTFTQFKVTTSSAELSLSETFSTIAFYMYGGLYNSFNGTPVDNIHVDFINAESGELIESADSSDLQNAE